MATKPKSATSGTKDVATKQDQMPDYIKNGNGRGSENVSSSDIMLPRIDVIQAIGPQLKSKDEKYIEGAKMGDLFNTLTSELYPEGVNIIPVTFFKQYLVWEDRDKGQGGLQGVFDTLSEAEAKAAENDLWEAVETPTHVVVILDDDGNPVSEATIPMAKSKYKVSKRFNSLVRLNGGDRFSRVYTVGSVDDTGPKGDFYNLTVHDRGWPTKDAYEYAERLYEAISQGDVSVRSDYSGEDAPDEAEI